MRGLVSNLPDAVEIVTLKGCSDEMKGAGGKIERPHMDTPIVEILVAHFTSIPATHKIGAARYIGNCQIVIDMLENVDEHTLNPTKYPPGQAATPIQPRT